MLLLGLLAFSQQQVHLDEIISLANNYVLPTRQTTDAIDTIYCKNDDGGGIPSLLQIVKTMMALKIIEIVNHFNNIQNEEDSNHSNLFAIFL